MGTFSFCIKARGSKFLFYICLIGLKRLPQLSKQKWKSGLLYENSRN